MVSWAGDPKPPLHHEFNPQVSNNETMLHNNFNMRQKKKKWNDGDFFQTKSKVQGFPFAHVNLHISEWETHVWC